MLLPSAVTASATILILFPVPLPRADNSIAALGTMVDADFRPNPDNRGCLPYLTESHRLHSKWVNSVQTETGGVLTTSLMWKK